jgi:4-hydroxy-4-methyl-2-oxoglutarate aldolase
LAETGSGIDFAVIQEKLYSAVIADVLDDLGYRHQALRHDVRPIDPEYKVVGRAYTVLAADVYETPDEPYLKELQAVDSLSEGDVLVATTNGSASCGLWGELLSTAAISKGARGAVIDGMTRDGRAIRELGFPVFARGYNPLDSKGRMEVIAHGVRIRCGDAFIAPGDVVFGDLDGVVVIPQEVVGEALRRALEKAGKEDSMKRALRDGMGILDAYDKYGIL